MAEQSRNISLVILGIIAIIAVIGLVMMFKMSATGDVVSRGRSIAKVGKAVYTPPRGWGSAIAGTQAVQQGQILGQSCVLLTENHVSMGLIDMDDYNDPSRGCCGTYFRESAQQYSTENCCLQNCLRAEVNVV
jgi:hypothetical protein